MTIRPRLCILTALSITMLSIPALSLTGSAAAQTTDVLLIPDSGPIAGRVWALSPVDGSVITNSFIPGDTRLTQPIQIIDSGRGTLLVTDEVAKSVFEYSARGNYLATIASGLEGSFGICLRDGNAYVTSGFSAGVGGKIYRIALDGSAPVVFSDWTGIGDPRGIVPYGAGFLVGNSIDDDLEVVGSTGSVNPVPFYNSDGIISINFPQQIVDIGNGNLMVAGFSAPWGVYFFDSGAFVYAVYRAPEVYLSPRGTRMLENGEILYTGGTRIDRFSTKTYANTNIVNQAGASFRWVTRYTPPTPCPADVNGDRDVNANDLATILSGWGTTDASADINGDGTVSALDLAILLGNWGPC